MPGKAKAKFDVHPGVLMVQSVIAGMQEKTGRPLEDWLELGWIAELSLGKGEESSPEGYLRSAEQYVEKMFSGPKAGLRPIYDALFGAGRKLGKDVRVCPCRTMVPWYRHHVFAQIKPATRSRIDLGLALKDTKTPRRLIDTGGFARWMKAAYEMDQEAG